MNLAFFFITSETLNGLAAALGIIFGIVLCALCFRAHRAQHRRVEEQSWPRRPGLVLSKWVTLKCQGGRCWLNQKWAYGDDCQITAPKPPIGHRFARYYLTVQDVRTAQTLDIEVSAAEFELIVVKGTIEYSSGRYGGSADNAPACHILAPSPA